MAKLAIIQASNGILAQAKAQFNSKLGDFPAILQSVAEDTGIELAPEVIVDVCGCVIHEVKIDKDTLMPTITLEIRANQAVSYVASSGAIISANAQKGSGSLRLQRPEGFELIYAFRNALNEQIRFEEIVVHPHAILETAHLPREAEEIHRLSAPA